MFEEDADLTVGLKEKPVAGRKSKKFYLESRGQVVLEEPEFDWSFGVLQNRQHHNPERG